MSELPSRLPAESAQHYRERSFNEWFFNKFKRKPLCHVVTEDIHLRESFYAGFDARSEYSPKSKLNLVKG